RDGGPSARWPIAPPPILSSPTMGVPGAGRLPVYDLAPPTRDGDVPLSPEEIENRTFQTAVRGYDRAAVDAFLHQVAAEVRRLQGETARPKQRPDVLPALPALPAPAALPAAQ